MAGFGASGRNGGWCSALFPTSWQKLVAASSEDGARRMHPGDARHGPRGRPGRRGRGHRRPLPPGRHRRRWPARRCSWSGSARRSASARARGFTEDDERLLEPDEAAAMLAADAGARRHLHPALRRDPPVATRARTGPRGRGERGVASSSTPACSAIAPGRVETDAGTVRAEVVLRATEGYTAQAGGAAARRRAGVLADGRDRAAHRRRCGRPSGSRTGRRSPTRGT